MEAKNPGVRKKFWTSLDSIINLKKCNIYSFIPDDEAEVFGVGNIWTLNYFFVNKSAKRICLLTCSGVRKMSKYNRNVVDMEEDYSFSLEPSFNLDVPHPHGRSIASRGTWVK
mmetsp:Transcript_4761/g.7072  ORF Transcript_4761/g.7072 Transcript_4761/m.7072 type:complete len:113 (-) Transcript_4761:237-575(-)